MNRDPLQSLLTNLTREVEPLWTVTGYRTDGHTWRRDEVRTEVKPGAAVLPKTKRPVRGTIRVSVASHQRHKADRDLTNEMLSGAMLDSTPKWLSDSDRDGKIKHERE